MATIKQCDKCGAIIDVSAFMTLKRKRKCHNQHDGDYTDSIEAEFDLCEKCAREIELMIISNDLADSTIYT